MDELPLDAFVIRGGLFPEVDDVRVVLQDAIDDGYGPVLSVHIGVIPPGGTLDDALRETCIEARVPNGKVRVTAVGKLLDARLRIVHDDSDGQPACHHHVIFSEPVDLEQIRRFIECFDEPIPNPGKKAM